MTPEAWRGLSYYLAASAVVGLLGAVVLFFWIWWLSARRWGVLCFLAGWLPAGIIAYISFWVITLLWPLLVMGWGLRRLRTI
jgi:hypothetical protein